MTAEVSYQAVRVSLSGEPLEATLYLVGNALIARQITAADPSAALYAPFRVAIYRDAGGVHIAYDKPSSVFGSLRTPAIDAIAASLDQKIHANAQEACEPMTSQDVKTNSDSMNRTTDVPDPLDGAMNVVDSVKLVERYVELWNEPDPDVRRAIIEELWSPDGVQVLVDPPEEVRAAAARLRFATPTLQVRGYDALEARVTRAWEMFGAAGEFAFTARGPAAALLRNVVTFRWEMTSMSDGDVAGAGLEVLSLGDDGRIRDDYQFIEG